VKLDFYPNNLRFSPDSRTLWVDHRRLELAPALRQTGAIPTAFGTVIDVAFAADAQSLVAIAGDTSVNLYSQPGLKPLASYRDLAVEPFAAAYSSDGRRLVVGTADGRMLILDPRTLALGRAVAGVPEASVQNLWPAGNDLMLVSYRPWVGGATGYGALDLKARTFRRISTQAQVASVSARKGQIWFYGVDGSDLKAWPWRPGS
jgi:hypothetical protein